MKVLEEDVTTLAERVDRALESIREMPEREREKAMELKKSIEAFHELALRKIVRALRETDAGKEALLKIVEDPAVYAVFLMHGIVKQDLFTRVAAVIDEVRPYMQSHGGDVELVQVDGNTVHVRLNGACSGCSLSAVTLKRTVEEAIKARIPEIEYVLMATDELASRFMPSGAAGSDLNLERRGWIQGPHTSELEEERPVRVVHEQYDLLVVCVDEKVMAFRNSCPHMGLALDKGLVDGGVLVCPGHGFRFDLTSGECLTAPYVQLEPFPVRVEDHRVWIRLD